MDQFLISGITHKVHNPQDVLTRIETMILSFEREMVPIVNDYVLEKLPSVFTLGSLIAVSEFGDYHSDFGSRDKFKQNLCQLVEFNEINEFNFAGLNLFNSKLINTHLPTLTAEFIDKKIEAFQDEFDAHVVPQELIVELFAGAAENCDQPQLVEAVSAFFGESEGSNEFSTNEPIDENLKLVERVARNIKIWSFFSTCLNLNEIVVQFEKEIRRFLSSFYNKKQPLSDAFLAWRELDKTRGTVNSKDEDFAGFVRMLPWSNFGRKSPWWCYENHWIYDNKHKNGYFFKIGRASEIYSNEEDSDDDGGDDFEDSSGPREPSYEVTLLVSSDKNDKLSYTFKIDKYNKACTFYFENTPCLLYVKRKKVFISALEFKMNIQLKLDLDFGCGPKFDNKHGKLLVADNRGIYELTIKKVACHCGRYAGPSVCSEPCQLTKDSRSNHISVKSTKIEGSPSFPFLCPKWNIVITCKTILQFNDVVLPNNRQFIDNKITDVDMYIGKKLLTHFCAGAGKCKINDFGLLLEQELTESELLDFKDFNLDDLELFRDYFSINLDQSYLMEQNNEISGRNYEVKLFFTYEGKFITHVRYIDRPNALWYFNYYFFQPHKSTMMIFVLNKSGELDFVNQVDTKPNLFFMDSVVMNYHICLYFYDN